MGDDGTTSEGMDLHDSEAILRLFFGCQGRQIAEFVVLMPLPRDNLDDLRKLCDEVWAEFSGWVGAGFTGLARGHYITAICPGTGSSQVGDATLALGYSPCRRAIFIGSVGGLGDRMRVGDIVVVEEAVIGEGFSRYHAAQAPSEDLYGQLVRADDALVEALWVQARTKVRELDVVVHRGRVFTIESLLAESEQFLQAVAGRGCIGIEKEASALFTAARKAGIRATAALCVSDLPLHQQSLFVKRTRKVEEKRVSMRHVVIPQIVLGMTAGLRDDT